ncbi:hypothetical protein BBD42_12095 [Paenibacillus sp. BIHB 4019]|uniref:DNA-binding response regulator n=1 Tax=Paenibacillus sp. BIHB 4019 TaxID=1870819 RepID=A0A1B2DHE9_9BACL|nr:response regulator [Paenibacillus sp. BIHB 4019]ANY67121.1 hypothetical protein BBD42_12095 [Paenibacillus sp. BIHB 4019]
MLNLLVVDDEPLILAGLHSIITKADTGFLRVETANDGIEALEKLQSYEAHLILTDIQMPEMTGLELIHEVKRNNLCERFIILTGYNDFDFVRQALRYQVLDYLLKPIDKEELVSALQNAAQLIHEDLQLREVKGATEYKETITEFTSLLDNKLLSEPMSKILDYIHQHYAKFDLSLEQVAEFIELNPSYVSALFKKEAGINFIPYLHTCRVFKAQQLMNEHPKMAIDKISFQVGYENPRYFFKVFKKYAGLTPGQYRDIDVDEDLK